MGSYLKGNKGGQIEKLSIKEWSEIMELCIVLKETVKSMQIFWQTSPNLSEEDTF